MGQVWAEMGRRLADAVVLPIDCRLYANFLAKNQESLYEGYGDAMMGKGIDLGKSLIQYVYEISIFMHFFYFI